MNCFENAYCNKDVLVFGDTGFKGTWLCAWLLKLGANVHGFADGIKSEPAMFNELGLGNRIKHHVGDIRDSNAVTNIISNVNPKFVFNLAAQPIVSRSYADPEETFATNAMGTLNILNALRGVDFNCNAVLITSDKCYFNQEWIWGYKETDRLGGKDPYSASKAAAEIIIECFMHSYFSKVDSPVRLAVARAGNVIGGGDWAENRIVPDAVRAWAMDKDVLVRRPNATRPWQHVLEPLSGYLTLGQQIATRPELNGEAFNFGPSADQNESVLTLLRSLSSNWFGDVTAEKITVAQTDGFAESGLLKLNCDKAFAQLKWLPSLSFDQCTKMTANWYRSFYSRSADVVSLTEKQIDEYVTLAGNSKTGWVEA